MLHVLGGGLLWRRRTTEEESCSVWSRGKVRWQECNCAGAASVACVVVCWQAKMGIASAVLLPSRRLAACLLPSFSPHTLYTHTHHTYNTEMSISQRAWRPHLASFLLPLVLLGCLYTTTDGFRPLQAQRLSRLRVPLNEAPQGHGKHAPAAKGTSRRRASSNFWALQVRLLCFLVHPLALPPPIILIDLPTLSCPSDAPPESGFLRPP